MGRGFVIIAVLAACGGAEPAVTATAAPRPRLQLVRCAPAMPPPVVADDGVSFGGLTKAETLELRRAHRASAQPRGAQVVLGAATMMGAFDRAVLTRVVRAELISLRACYERELAKAPVAAGRLDVAFTIEADGRVGGVSMGSRATPGLAACVTRIVSGLRFPPPPGGASVRVSYPMTFDVASGAPPGPTPPGAPPPTEPVGELATSPWTPFALDASPPLPVAPMVARVTETAVRQRLDRLDACFTGGAPSGSLRALLELDPAGELRHVRVGGLGDPASEACLRRAFSGLRVLSPTLDGVEVACDLSRGDAQRWRVTPADYEVITTTRTQAIHAGQAVEVGATEPDALPANRTYLITIQRDTPGTVLELALAWAFDGDATLIATDRGTSPPVLVGVGRSTFALGDAHDSPGALEVSLEVSADRLAACVGATTEEAALADPRALDALLARLAERCRRTACTSTLPLAVDGGASADGLVSIVDALRRAGFERLLIGDGVGCHVAADAGE